MSRFHRNDFDLLPERAFRPRPFGGMTLEGKGGAPAPDPRLAEAQIRSMGIQDDSIQEILAQQRELQPLQKEQLQFGLDSARTAYSQSQEDRNWLLSRRSMLAGTQDKMVADAASFDTDAKREELAGTALTDVNSAFSSARGQAARSAASYGITPGSGRSLAMDSQLTTAQALASAGVMTGARRAAREEGRALTDRAQNALAGYPAMSMGATGAGAAYGASGVSIAGQGQNNILAPTATASQLAGSLGTNATGMFGVQQQAYSQAQAQKGQMLGTILGAGSTLGAAYLGKSDRRLKTKIVAVGRDAPTGLALYEFEYLSGVPAGRWRGVMADEVKRTRPDAVVRMTNGFDAVNYALLGIEFKQVEAEHGLV